MEMKEYVVDCRKLTGRAEAHDHLKEVFGFPGGPPHDPCTIVWLIDPSVITLKPMHATVDISRGESYGRTNCDFFNYQKKEINANVAVAVDVDRYWDVIEKELRRYDG